MLYATMRIGNNCEYFLFQSVTEYLSHRQERELKSDIFTTYKDSLQIKDPEDILLLLKQVSENKDVAK